jgi:LysM repeat protein
MMMKTRLVATLIIGLLAALVLAACERSASTQVLPTATTEIVGPGGGGAPGSDPTMDALGTQLAQSATQTVEPGGLPGGGAVAATATPIAGLATATAIPVTATVGAPTAVPSACASPYTVKQGDWIYKIARECKLDPKAIIAANPGINPNRLTPGQKINLPGAAATPQPGAPTPTAVQACTGTYTVKAGDNLFRIAFNCGLTTEQLARTNNIPFPYTIYPGQVIKYP